jgi:hypothetical protein
MAEAVSGRARMVTSTPNSVRCQRHSKSGVSFPIWRSTPARSNCTPAEPWRPGRFQLGDQSGQAVTEPWGTHSSCGR